MIKLISGLFSMIIGLVVLYLIAMVTFLGDNPLLITEEYHILTITEDEEEAIRIADSYNIDLNFRSEMGVASYTTNSLRQYDALIENSIFSINEKVDAASINYGEGEPSYDQQYNIPLSFVDRAWEYASGEGVKVAVIDSGVDINHVEFAGNVSSLSYNSREKLVGIQHVLDTNGHGSAVSSVISAAQNNQGMIGVAPNVELVSIKASIDDTSSFFASDIIEGILYATEIGVDVISISIAFGFESNAMKQAIDEARAAGIVVVSTSANTGQEGKFYPAAYDGVISTGSVGEDGEISWFSTYHETVDIVAAGNNIPVVEAGGALRYATGTSFAAPFVAGVVALMLEHEPSLTPEEVETRLFETAIDKGEPGKDIYYGHGLVNALSALVGDIAILSFDTNTDEVQYEEFITTPGTITALPEDPVREHYNFQGWYAEETFENEITDPSLEVWVNTTVYAKWEPKQYTVNYYSGLTGKIFNTETFYYGDLLADAVPINVTGYTFNNWALGDNTLFSPSEQLDGNASLTAIYTANTYDISFVVNSEIVTTLTVTYDSTYGVTLQPERTGHTFSEWRRGEEYFDVTQPYTIDRNITLEAYFVPNDYTVTFKSYDGSTISEETFTYGTSLSTLNVPEGPTRDNYTFSRWSSVPTRQMPDRNIEITPVYERILNRVLATVTFDIVYEDGTVEEISFTVSSQAELDALIAEYGVNFDREVFQGQE